MGPGGEDDRRGGVAGGHGYADLHALSDAEQATATRAIGIPQQVSSAGLVDAFPIADRWLSDLEEDAAFGKLDAWAAKVQGDPEFTALIYRTLMMGDMGGQLFVRTVEVPESAPRTTALAVVRNDAFFALPFEEAIAAFLERKLITPEEYRRLSGRAKAQAFSVSQMTSAELVARVRDVLGRTLSEGGDYRSFVAQVRAGEVDLGISPTRPGYLTNIFRTNTASAYGSGRYRQLTDPAVVAARPYLEFRTARDSRVSESHATLEGVVFRQDDPAWPRLNPPLRWQCRCGVVARRADAVDMSRVRSAADFISIPAPGFGS